MASIAAEEWKNQLLIATENVYRYREGTARLRFVDLAGEIAAGRSAAQNV